MSSSADFKIGTPSNSINGATRKLAALFVTVHYKNETSTVELLDSLSKLDRFSDVDVAVVANDSGEEQLLELKEAGEKFKNVELLEPKANLGYFGAARFALNQYLSKARVFPDWVIVCNHDVVIADQGFFSKLFNKDPMIAGILAPRIQVMRTKIDQNPFMEQRPNWLRWTSLRLIFSSYKSAALWDWLSSLLKKMKIFAKRTERNLNPHAIYAPHGSFFIFSKKYFEAGGNLDCGLFLFGEEISVAEICRLLGLTVMYEPTLCVLHNEHSSTGKRISRFTYKCQQQALQYLNSRYFSRSKSAIGSYRAN